MSEHLERAKRALESADDYANRDSPASREHREALVDYRLRVAQTEATMAVAEGLDALTELLEEACDRTTGALRVMRE